LRSGAGAVLEAASDKRTAEALDRLAGPDWRWAVRAASVASEAAREVIRDAPDVETGPGAGRVAIASGEPAALPIPEQGSGNQPETGPRTID
jgi:hypothetical protein